MLPQSAQFITLLTPEANENSTTETQPNNGLYISPSINVPGRGDITGYVLSAANSEGKCIWSDASAPLLPPALQSIADLTTSANEMLYTTAPNTYNVSTLTPLGRSFLTLLTTTDQRQQLGLEIGVDVQAFSNVLQDLTLIPSSNNLIPYTTGSSYSGTTLSPFVRTNVLPAADASALATTLGYITGSVSTVNVILRVTGANTVGETGLSIDNLDNLSGVNDLSIGGNFTSTGTVNGVTTTEFAQLANINAVTIANTQWSFLGNMDQNVDSGSTPQFSGLSAGNQKITSVLDPTNNQDAATKNYVDVVAATGAPPLANVDLATDAVLPDTPVYASPAETLTSVGGPGVLVVDSIVTNVGDRILVKNQADNRENGIYDVTDDGSSPGPNWVLTRSSDFNQAAMPLLAGASVFVQIVVGASNSASTYALSTTINNIDPLTDAVIWVQVGGSPTFSAGLGIDAAELVGGTIQIENTARFSYSGNALELATVTVPFGGTGLTTITSGNVLVGDGVNPVDDSKQAPTGDFVGTTDTQVLTNKTLTDSTNDVTATGLFSGGGTNTIDVSAAANPIANQVLVTTSATTAEWRSRNTTTFANTLRVSPTNPDVSPNWSTIGAAIADAITLVPTATDPVLIEVYPGSYAEATPLTVPEYVTVSGLVGTGSTVIVRPTAPAPVGAIFVMNGNANLFGLIIDGNDLAGGFATIGISSTGGAVGSRDYVESCTIQDVTISGLSCAGNGTAESKYLDGHRIEVVVTQASPFAMTNGIICSSGAFMHLTDILVEGNFSGGGTITNGINCLNDFSVIETYTMTVRAISTGVRIGTGVTSNSFEDYPNIVAYDAIIDLYSVLGTDANVKSQFTFFNYTHRDNAGIYPTQVGFRSTNPSAPADPNNFTFIAVSARNTRTEAAGDLTNGPTNLGSIIDRVPGNQNLIFIGDVSQGPFNQGHAFNSSEGVDHITGMVVWQDNGGVFTNITSSLVEPTLNPFECDLATTAAIDLASAPATIDGVAPAAGVSRILVKDGSTANPGTTSVDNGIYVWNGTGNPMTRAADFAAGSVIFYNTFFAVDGGDVNYGSRWKIDAATFTGNRITVGTTAWGLSAFSVNLFTTSPANNDAIYIGSAAVTLFPSIQVALTADLTTSSGTSVTAVVWEYFNGVSWVTQPLMSTLADQPYTQFANQTLGFGSTSTAYEKQSFHYRIGDQSGWVPTTVNLVFGYWIRCRVINAGIITQTPVAEFIRLGTNKIQIGPEGFLQYFGTGRVRKRQVFSSTTGQNTSFTSGGNENLVAADNGTTVISQNFLNCQFNNGTDAATGWTWLLPNGIDTSFPITAHVHFVQFAAGTGNIAFQVDYVQTTAGSILGTNGTPTTSLFSTGIVPSAVGGAAGEQALAEIELPIETFLVNHQLFWFQIVRFGPNVLDTYSGNIAVPIVELEYVIWAEGTDV